MGLEKNRGMHMTKTIHRKDLQHAITDAVKLTREAAKIGVSAEYHHRAGKAWDRVAFLTKDIDKEVYDDAQMAAKLEYERAEELQK